MNGSLALVGSGEYLPVMAEFENSLIKDGVKNGKEPIYIQIPTAAGQESDNRLNYWRELGKVQADALGVKSIFLPIFTREDAFNLEYVKQIKDSALIYLSGGDPHYLAQTLIGTPIWDSIFKSWQSGTSLAGCSAGAMVLSAQVPNFKFSKKSQH
jgi:cyanophycinase-like exopeptidase